MIAMAGFAATLPLMMAGWIPFRSRTADDAFAMWGTMLNPASYGHLSLGLAPNTYLATAVLMTGMSLVWAWCKFAVPAVSRRPWAELPLATLYYAAVIAAVVLCLEAKNQFIYFQF